MKIFSIKTLLRTLQKPKKTLLCSFVLMIFAFFFTLIAPISHALAAEKNSDTVQEFVLTDDASHTPNLTSIMQNMQARYDGMQSMTASFRQELRHRNTGSGQVNDGLLQWRKPLLVRWEVLGANAELFVVGQDSIWNYFPDEEVAYIYPLDLVENSMDIIKVVTGQSPLEEDFSVIDEGVEKHEDGRSLARLHLYPHEPAQNFTEAVLWLDIKSYLIDRVLIYDFYGNENDVTFQNIMPDAQVTDDAITFSPPAEIEIIDQRK